MLAALSLSLFFFFPAESFARRAPVIDESRRGLIGRTYGPVRERGLLGLLLVFLQFARERGRNCMPSALL